MKSEVIFHILREKLFHFFRFISSNNQYDIIVFSHLRWNFLFQRPHYMITRLAQRNKILYIEEPIPFHPLDRGTTSLFYPQKNITVLQPKITLEHIQQDLPLLIAKQLREQRMQHPVLWFYSPVFRDIVPLINHSLVVYDYMGKQALYDSDKTESLFTDADIIFSNDKRFFEKKKQDFSNLYYLPNSVVFSEDVSSRLQRIMQKTLATKHQPTLYTQPFYHPVLPQLTSVK